MTKQCTSPALRAGEVEMRSIEGEGRAARTPPSPLPAASDRVAPVPALQPIVIAAGGTGGHFFPAEALAAELLTRGHRVVLMTDARSGGLQSAVFAGHDQYVIPGAGIAGRGIGGRQRHRALAAGVQARRHPGPHRRRCRGRLRRLSLRRAGARRAPAAPPPAVILHEQNAVLGRANRFLARRADVLALSFAGTSRVPETAATVVTGNPVRPPSPRWPRLPTRRPPTP